MTGFNNENKYEIIKTDNSDSNEKAYSDIFKEMLYLENLEGMKNKTKYCLIRLWIKNLDALIGQLGSCNKNDFLSAFSSILTKNLRSVDLYLKTEESNFLILFPGTTIDNIVLALKRIENILLKEFNIKVEMGWRVIKASNNKEDIMPFINRNIQENKTVSNSTVKVHEKVIQQRFGLNSIFKKFIISYLIFFGIILIIGIIVYFAE